MLPRLLIPIVFLSACAPPVWLAGCRKPSAHDRTLTLATTTSTRDSGLLDDLLPIFERQTGIEVRVVAVGTGQALELGRRGDADVLLTHAEHEEVRFVREGYGIRRIPVMANDFVLVGPPSASPVFRDCRDVLTAVKRLAERQMTFVSRGDRSGTHMKELALWQQARVVPRGRWYLQSGSGMAQTLRVANEKQAITLTDRGTFLAHRSQLDLQILVEGDPQLKNPYAAIVVNPAKHPHVHADAARAFVVFLLAPATQRRIGEFGEQQFGMPLFYPHSGEETPYSEKEPSGSREEAP